MKNDGGAGSNVSIIKEFFNSQSSAGDLTSVLSNTSIWFQIVIWIIMFVGAIALGIWIFRIAIDIILIVTRGMGGNWRGKMQNWGTTQEDNYSSIWTYLSKNILEIILVILVVVLLFTGYLFRIIAFAIDGLGTLLNRFMGLDVGGKLSALDAEAFVNNIESQRATSLRNQYDEQLSGAREYSNQLYDLAKSGAIEDDPQYNQLKSEYTQAMVKANILGEELIDRGVESEFKLGEGYFQQHLRQDGDGVCNDTFIVEDVEQTFDVGGANAQITCKN